MGEPDAGLEPLLGALLTRFVECPAASIDEEIVRAQRRVAEHVGLDRSTLWQATRGPEGGFRLTHFHGVDLPPSVPPADARTLFPWTLERTLRGEVVALSRLVDLPPEAAPDARTWRRNGTRSTLVLPMATDSGQVLGALSFDTVHREVEWPQQTVARLELVARAFAAALARQRAEQARQAERARYLLLRESMTEAFVSVSMDGRLAEFNEAYRAMLGYSREELQRLTFQELTPPRWHALEAEILATQVMARGASEVYTKEYRRKDGSVFPVELRTFLIRDASGRAEGMWAIVRDITRRVQRERELRESEERLRLATEGARIGVFDADLVTGTSYWSPEMRAIVGVPEEATPAGTLSVPDFVHPDDAEQLREAFQRAVDPGGGGSVLNEHRVVWPDGSVHWVQFRAQLQFAGEDEGTRRPIRMRGTVWDVTPRKKAEEALRERNRYIETILEQAPIGFAVRTADDGVAQFVSARYEEIYACPRGTVTSQRAFFENVWRHDPELGERIRSRVMADYASGDSARWRWENVPIPLASGETRYITATSIEVPAQNLIVTTVQDVTDRVRAEERLRQSELRFRQVAESVSDFIWEVDERGLYTYTSPSVERILGYTPEEIVGRKHFFDLFPLESRERLKAAALEAFAARQPFRGFPNPNLAKDGRIVHLETSGVPVLDESGELRGYRGADTDITDRKRAEELLAAERERLQAERDYLERESVVSHTLGVVGRSPAIRQVLAQVEQVAPTDSSVLVVGETGTGKELVAHAIHQLSRRKDRLMVTVNCAALHDALIESELFGYEKGAYTGAVAANAGRFELADGSTLFLDEVAELPLELQGKLLRVLETGEFERLGSSRTRKVDVRVVAATNRDLAEEVRQRRFRQDLYYRLNVFPIRIPPLRDRREDIPLLVWGFAEYFSRRAGKTIDSIPREAMERLQQLAWPGNVRELRNVVERAVILSTGRALAVSLPPGPGAITVGGDGGRLTLEEVERRHILEVLDRTGGRVAGRDGAAALLGLNRTTLQSRMKKLGIGRPRRSGPG